MPACRRPRRLVGEGELFALKAMRQSVIDKVICEGASAPLGTSPSPVMTRLSRANGGRAGQDMTPAARMWRPARSTCEGLPDGLHLHAALAARASGADRAGT